MKWERWEKRRWEKTLYKKRKERVYDIPIPLSAIYRCFHHTHTTNDVSIFSAIVVAVIVVVGAVVLSFLPITRSVSIRAYRQHRWACSFTRPNEQDVDAVERVHVMLLIYSKWTRNRIMLQLLQINESHSSLQVDVIVCTSIRYLRCDSLQLLW